ncbi:MAG: hypothetical protein QXP98_02630 [Thermoproteus sp.]
MGSLREAKLRAGMAGSLLAGSLILFVLAFMQVAGLFNPINLTVMTALVVVAGYVYGNFKTALGEKWFTRLGPPVIGLAAVGVALMWAGSQIGPLLVVVAYWGEPVMGYFIYKKLRWTHRAWAAVFLASAALYAYTLPLVLAGLWAVPAAADAVKLVALAYFMSRKELVLEDK